MFAQPVTRLLPHFPPRYGALPSEAFAPDARRKEQTSRIPYETLGGQPLRIPYGTVKTELHSHPAIPYGQNPKHSSGIARDPGQQARFWCKEIQNLLRFIRDSEVSGLLRSGIAGCECNSVFTVPYGIRRG